MNESENLWSIEDLVTQMEMLQEENSKQNQLLLQKEEQIQKLSSEISDLQSILLTLKSQLQEKSELIVKLKGADLILKENEQLKENDRQRENRLNEIRRNAEAEVKASKGEYSRKKLLLDYYTTLRKHNAEDLERKIFEQDKLIEESAGKKFESYKNDLDKKYLRQHKSLQAKYAARHTALNAQLFSSILYAAIVTLLSAVRSDTFLCDVGSFFDSLAGNMTKYLSFIINTGRSAASICMQIDDPALQSVLYWVVLILVAALLLTGTGALIYFPLRKYVSWYKKEISDSLSIWVAVITIALTVFLPDEIKSILPLNLITINLITHLIYTAIRAYVGSNNSNNERY